jgi:hypothetical protein
MNTLTAGSLTILALTLAAPLVAAEAPRSRVGDLEAAQQKVARAADRTKGGPRQLLLQERQRLGRLIDDLEAGRSVDPAEIDQALQRAERGTW